MKRWLRRHYKKMKRAILLATAVEIIRLIVDSASFLKHQENEGTYFGCVVPNNDSDYKFENKLRNIENCPKIEVYPYTFVHFKDIVIDPLKAKQSKGGENIVDVKGQTAGDENLDPEPGYFSIKCNNSRPSSESFQNSFSKEFGQIFRAIRFRDSRLQYERTEERFTIALHRTDYANLYHTLTELYNVFVISYILKKATKCKVHILFLDCHPYSYLDDTWSMLFGTVTRAGFIHKKTMFRNLVLSLQGFQSLMNEHSLKDLPVAEYFTRFVLHRYGLNKRTIKDCKNLYILVILRHDYVAHPRNPTGKITRKIRNEKQLLHTISTTFKDHHVQGVQLDKLSMYEQLSLISRTNVLIGMHGAGLSHVLFLPHGSAVIELYPKHTDTSNRHFRAMARWRKLSYMAWQNVMDWNEFEDGSTKIPTGVLIYIMKKMIKKICD